MAKSKDTNQDRERAISLALGAIEKQFGKGSIMRLGEGDTDPHEDLQSAGQFGLASDAFDRLADDDAHADRRADGSEAVTHRCDVAGDLGENRSCVHGFFLSVEGGFRADPLSALPPPRAGCRPR